MKFNDGVVPDQENYQLSDSNIHDQELCSSSTTHQRCICSPNQLFIVQLLSCINNFLFRQALVLILVVSVHVEAIDIKSNLSTLLHEDVVELEGLFHKLVFNDHFAYTLLGGKAVSLSSCFDEVPWEKILKGSKQGIIFWHKWETWIKHRSQFQSKHFLLFKEKSNYLDNVSLIFLINKKLFTETFKKYQKTFDYILGHQTSPEKILEDLESGNTTLQSAFLGNEILLGIMLGYGEHNASLYSRRDELYRTRGYSKLMLKKPKPSEGFETIEDEIQYLHNVLSFYDTQGPLLVFNSVNFAADPSHPETITLIEKYRRLGQEISQTYKDKNFLEVTLSLLTAE
jgi:hypothetical protein